MRKIKKLPQWCETTQQGIAFWIGYHFTAYRFHPLTEGAIVSETCKFIQSQLREDEMLFCEVEYKHLIPNKNFSKPKTRADLVIIQNNPPAKYGLRIKNDISKKVTAVIEVKRSSSGKTMINKDLKRLYEVIAYDRSRKKRGFLLLISQHKIYKPFISNDGTAKKRKIKIPGIEHGHALVRRVCKATASFKKPASAHYAAIIEVFAE